MKESVKDTTKTALQESRSKNLAPGNSAPGNSVPVYWGWLNIVVAAVAMTATLPGRTHGLGLITEPMLQDLAIGPVEFARMNFISAIVGASFCLPVGWLIDRFGVRKILAVVALALGFSVIGMSDAGTKSWLLVSLILVRGFGQSALSLLSIALIAKWFSRRVGVAMGVFAVLLTFGFIASVLAMGRLIEDLGWSVAWRGLGWTIVALAVCFWFLAADRNSSELKVASEPEAEASSDTNSELTWTLSKSLKSPAFWILVFGCAAFNLVWSGVTLFNESIVAERGLDQSASVEIMAILTGVGLIANLVAGALATRERVLKLLCVGLIFLAIGLFGFAQLSGVFAARFYAVAIGLSGGIIAVVFFSAWRHLFGETQFGRIQGSAQLATVLASATGPVVMAESYQRLGSYQPVFMSLSILVGVLAVVAFFIRLER